MTGGAILYLLRARIQVLPEFLLNYTPSYRNRPFGLLRMEPWLVFLSVLNLTVLLIFLTMKFF